MLIGLLILIPAMLCVTEVMLEHPDNLYDPELGMVSSERI